MSSSSSTPSATTYARAKQIRDQTPYLLTDAHNSPLTSATGTMADLHLGIRELREAQRSLQLEEAFVAENKRYHTPLAAIEMFLKKHMQHLAPSYLIAASFAEKCTRGDASETRGEIAYDPKSCLEEYTDALFANIASVNK